MSSHTIIAFSIALVASCTAASRIFGAQNCSAVSSATLTPVTELYSQRAAALARLRMLDTNRFEAEIFATPASVFWSA
jgi:hypothetical protein